MSPEEMFDPVERPPHYTSSPSGIECITVTEHMNFCRGNAIKYLWRAGDKGNAIEDLKKARWYIDREIARLEKTEPKVAVSWGLDVVTDQPLLPSFKLCDECDRKMSCDKLQYCIRSLRRHG